GRQPVRVVLDREATLPGSLRLFTDALAPMTVAVVGEGRRPDYADALEAAGGLVLPTSEKDGHLDLVVLLEKLGAGVGNHRPMQSLLVEAGPALATALARADLVDRLALFIAPKLVGDGRPSFADLGIERMADALTFAEQRWECIGEDILFLRVRHPAVPQA